MLTAITYQIGNAKTCFIEKEIALANTAAI